MRHWPVLLLVALVGCDSAIPTQETPTPAPPDAATLARMAAFDPLQSGVIRGEVTWAGPRPDVPRFRSFPDPISDNPGGDLRDWPNPNVPQFSKDGRVRSALVFLRGLSSQRPWHLPPVRVRIDKERLAITQGATSGNIGVVRVGDVVEFAVGEASPQVLQGRAADFFALPLLPENPRVRRMSLPGLVELRSGSGLFWLRGYLFVTTHPYHAHTDAEGRFTLDQVPPGEYDLVVWHPNWRVEHEERHVDFLRVTQIQYQTPLEATRRVRVSAGASVDVSISLGR